MDSINLQSLLGYSKDSPFAGNPYLDIHTPEGLIDMSNTPIDLMGVDMISGKKKIMKAGRKNPYLFDSHLVREIPMQRGGNIFSKKDVLDFLFEDEGPKKEEIMAPSEAAVPQEEQQQPEGPDKDYELALQIANMAAMGEEGNPYVTSGEQVNSLAGYGKAYENIDSNVAAATQELLTKFPNLHLTSGRRSWGDKDAHPKGRAVDISYDKNAYDYYKNVIVPKYGFNKALDPNHGTGPHIHLGYY